MTWRRQHSQLTSATPAQLWERWTRTELWQVDDPGVQWAQLDGPVAVGTTGVVKNHGTPAQRFELTRVEHERAMDLVIRLPLATLSITHDLRSDAGDVRITHGVVLDGPLHRVYAAVLGASLARGLPTVVRRITAGALQDGPQSGVRP
jgi:hypothetical protein